MMIFRKFVFEPTKRAFIDRDMKKGGSADLRLQRFLNFDNGIKTPSSFVHSNFPTSITQDDYEVSDSSEQSAIE